MLVVAARHDEGVVGRRSAAVEGALQKRRSKTLDPKSGGSNRGHDAAYRVVVQTYQVLATQGAELDPAEAPVSNSLQREVEIIGHLVGNDPELECHCGAPYSRMTWPRRGLTGR